ncbi:MAG: copper chaperone PCu(A)C [Novosphingobium sp.]
MKSCNARNKGIQPVKPFNTFVFLYAAAALALLGGCQQATAPAPEESAAGTNGPNARPGIVVSDGRLVLPIVAGRPAAVYFSIRNDGTDAATLAGVHVAEADKAEMHKTEGRTMSAVNSVALAPGETVAFAPGGYHVMAFGLPGTLKPGETVELTLTFSDGDKVPVPLRIETIGGDMEGMHH